MFLLILGVVLILVGALVYRELGPEPVVRLAAAVLVIGGLILAAIGIVALADVHTDSGTIVAGDYSFVAPSGPPAYQPDSYGKG